jgi:prevent-host-death family protein
MASMTVSEARAALPRLLTRVDAGEEITITRRGKPVAVVVRPDAFVVGGQLRRWTEQLSSMRFWSRRAPPLCPRLWA